MKFQRAFLLLLISLFPFLSVQADGPMTETILIVVTNHGKLGDTGEKTGYFLAEVAHPWHVFKEAGYAIEFASPKGGFAPMDPKSFDLEDEMNKELWMDLETVQKLVHTQALGDLNLADYAAIFFAGGHGTMWDFPTSEAVADSIRTFVETDRPVGAVCHGPAALVNVTLSNGTHLLEGKTVNAFTIEEEEIIKLNEAMPFLLETRMCEAGATFSAAEPWQAHVAVDGLLVTGQNPASATQAAEAIVTILEK